MADAAQIALPGSKITAARFVVLRSANPLFHGEIHFPHPFMDFRGLTFPCDFSAGPYSRIDYPNEWKHLLGQRSDAKSCAETLRSMGMEPVIEETPGSYITIKWSPKMPWHLSKSDPRKVYDSYHNMVCVCQNENQSALIVKAVNDLPQWRISHRSGCASLGIRIRRISRALEPWDRSIPSSRTIRAVAARSRRPRVPACWPACNCGRVPSAASTGHRNLWRDSPLDARPAVAVFR